MKKSAVIGFLLLLTLSLLPYSAGADVVHDVQKVSGNQILPVNPMEVDGLVNDAENSYAWCEKEYNDKIYVGTVRNYMAEMSMGLPGGPGGLSLPPGMFPPMSDDRGKIYRRGKTDLMGDWELVYESPLITVGSEDLTLEKGYRAMEVYESALYVVSYPFFTGPYSRILRFTGCSTTPEEVFRMTNTSGSGLRGITIHNSRIYVGADSANILGVDPNGIPYGNTLVHIYRSDDPLAQDVLASDHSNMDSWNGWEEAGSPADFPDIDYFPGWSGVWDMISFNGYLYVFIADPINGFQMFKGENPCDPGWHKVVTKSAGGKYPAGLGNYENAAASPIIFNGQMYIGTFSNWNDIMMMMVQGFTGGGIEDLLGGLITMLCNWTPPQIYRSDTSDKWEMVVGDPGRSSPLKDFNYRIGNWRAGWYETPSPSRCEVMQIFHSVFGQLPPLSMISEYFPNFSFQRYMWRWCVHEGRLYVSTVDPRSMFEAIPQMMGGGNEELMNGIITFFDLVNSNHGGFDLYFTENGTEWIPITQDGGFGEIFGYFNESMDIIGDEFNGGRTMISTSEGIFLGTANAFQGCQIWLINPRIITDPIIPPPSGPEPRIMDTIIEGFYPSATGIPYKLCLTPCSAEYNGQISATMIEPEAGLVASLLKEGAEWSDNSIFFYLLPEGTEKIDYLSLSSSLNEEDYPWLREERPDLWWHDGTKWILISLTWTKGTNGKWSVFAQIPEEAWDSMMASTLDPEILNRDTSSEPGIPEDPVLEPEPSAGAGGGGCSIASLRMILWMILIPLIMMLRKR